MIDKDKFKKAKIIKIIYIFLGIICVIFASIGVFLPIMPTIPFLLAGGFFFAKSSEKLNNWFINTKLYKNNLGSLKQDKTMTKNAKIKILSSLTILMLLSEIFMVGNYIKKSNKASLFGALILFIVWFIHIYIFCFRIKTNIGDLKEEVNKHDAR